MLIQVNGSSSASNRPLEGRVAVVTGGARGLGAQVALDLAALGADVAVWDAPTWPDAPLGYPLSASDDLERTVRSVEEAGSRSLGVGVDVRDLADVERAVATTVAALGGIDVLVCAAGVRTVATGATMSDEEWDAVVDTNLHGVYHCLRAGLPHLEASGRGKVVVVAAEEGRRGAASLSHYSAAAWGAIGLAKSVAIEEAPYGVAVTVVCPGPMATVMGTPEAAAVAARPTATGGAVAVESVSETVQFAVTRPGLELTGSVLDVSAGLIAFNAS
ncbi:MAG: SDR family NAD(P)-dependent oxidoreductase [Actinomycetales bacterium]|nr:MAG: SDR family NAD(P)-dependent oxidoreductase [Actinomycetales bacterium]